MNPAIRKIIVTVLTVIGVYLAVQYLLPLALPFLLGAALALAAEPIVRFFSGRLHIPRAIAAGIGVTMAFSFLALVLLLLCGFVVRELRELAEILPDMESTLRSGMDSLSGWLMGMAEKAPSGIRALLTQNISEFFSGSAALLDRVMNWVLSVATGVLSRIPDSALLLGTGIISSFMISAKLPKIKVYLKERMPVERLRPVFSTLGKLKTAVFGWLKAQLKLCGVTFLVVALGLFLLGVPYGLLWAMLIAFVDALPVFGAGTALIPWSLVCFLQGDRAEAFGLLGIYAAAAVTRTVLEPRLVGKQLGLDPLVTLAALYTGYRLWGIGGMILAPMLAVAVAQLTRMGRERG